MIQWGVHMLQDRMLGRDEFLRLLQMRGTTLDWRLFKGEISLAFGCRINAVFNEYLPLDAVAVMLTSMLSRELDGGSRGLRIAAAVVRETWDLWLKLVMAAESDARLYKNEPLPANEQQYLVLGLKEGAPPKVVAGLMAAPPPPRPAGRSGDQGDRQQPDCLSQLADYPLIRGISIQAVLRQLRANARIYKVDLPDRLTDPDFPKWCEEIAAYQKLANMRFKAKTKAKRAKARRKELA
jgi:hypothetical protein